MYEEDRLRMRKERLARKKRRRRKQLVIRLGIFAVMVCFTIGVIATWMSLKKKEEAQEAFKQQEIQKQQEQREQQLLQERLAEAENILNQYYVQYFALPEEKESFSKWFLQNYSKEVEEELLKKTEDGSITDAEFYQLTGESIYVTSDRYLGRLDSTETAAQNHIYLRDGKREKEAEITIAGDLCFAEEGFVLDHYDTVNDLTKCISSEILEITNASDIFYINHEYCISDRGQALEGKYYTFRAKPERMELLKQMGADIVSLANNHVFDFGKDALLDTTDLLEQAGIPYVGGGRNIEEAKEPIYFIVNGMKIGFVGTSNGEKNRFTPQATETEPGILRAYDTTEYNQVIQKAAKECDYLIAYIHWGTEDTNYYNADQQRWGREFLNSGADIVIGGHPHVLQGIEYVGGKPIIYSLGDFWFNHETKYTGVLKLNITHEGLKEMSFVPCLQTGFTTRYLDTEEKQKKLYQFLEELSPNIKINEDGIITRK